MNKPRIRFAVSTTDGFVNWKITDRKDGIVYDSIRLGSGYDAMMQQLRYLECKYSTTLNKRFSLPCVRWVNFGKQTHKKI